MTAYRDICDRFWIPSEKLDHAMHQIGRIKFLSGEIMTLLATKRSRKAIAEKLEELTKCQDDGERTLRNNLVPITGVLKDEL